MQLIDPWLKMPGSDQRFPKSERLRLRREFLTVQRRGRKFHTELLLVFVRRRSTEAVRIGLTVSKKVGNAVQRNQVKRWLREVWRLNKEVVPSGLDVVLVAKRGAAEASFGELQRQFCHLERRLAANGGNGS